MAALTLRNQLQSVLTSYLGTYTLANGATTPAASVREPGETLPAGTKVSGLEMILIRTPDLDPVPEYLAPGAQRLWTVYLVGWSASDNLEPAAAAVVAAYPNTSVQPVIVPEGLGPQSQLRLVIRL